MGKARRRGTDDDNVGEGEGESAAASNGDVSIMAASAKSTDSRIAMKIVQERMAHHSSLNDDDDGNNILVDEENDTRPAGTSDEPHWQQQHQPPPTPGAIRVAGMNGPPDEQEGGGASDTMGASASSSRPFEPEVPVEAKLVEGGDDDDDTDRRRSLYMAEALEKEQVSWRDLMENKRLCLSILIGVCLVLTLAVGLAVGLSNNRGNNSNSNGSDPDTTTGDGDIRPSQVRDMYPNSTANTTVTDIIFGPFTTDLRESTRAEIVADPNSPEALANHWMSLDPNLGSYTPRQALQRFALATFYFATNGEGWARRDFWLNYQINECDWYTSHPSPICDVNGDYVILNMSSNALRGMVQMSDLFYYLKELHTFDLSDNSLHGPPPPLHGDHIKLVHLDYSSNFLRGKISAEFGWTNEHMRVCRIQDNLLSGMIPVTVYSILPNVEEMDLSGNLFTGIVPHELPAQDNNNTHLRILNLADNRLQGTLPAGLARFHNLTILNASGNVELGGTIPSVLATLPVLQVLDLSDTSITGTIPEDICVLQQEQALQLEVDCSSSNEEVGGGELLQCCAL